MNIERKYLVIIGWVMIAVVISLSLIKINAVMPNIKNGDKVGHFIAYFSLMMWFAWLYPRPLVRNLYAVFFIILGGVLEVLQSMTAYRTADIEDFHVNTIGVIAGFIIAAILSNVPFIKQTFKL